MRSILPEYYGLNGPDGILERPVMSSGWPVPDAVVTDDRERFLWAQFEHYPFNDTREFRRMAYAERGMLEGFIQLATAPAAKIRKFASRWGLLRRRTFQRGWSDIGDDGASHYGRREAIIIPSDQKKNLPKWRATAEVLDELDPLYAWRYYARLFAAALNVGARLREGKPPNPSDWEVMFRIYRPGVSPFAVKPKEKLGRSLFENWEKNDYAAAQEIAKRIKNPFEWKDPGTNRLLWHWWKWRNCVPLYHRVEHTVALCAIELEYWKEAANINIGVTMMEAKVEIRTQSLFAGLVWQLINTFANSSGIAICAECGSSFAPGRKPSTATRHFCPNCGRKAAIKLAVRDHRARQRQKGDDALSKD
jgi:predicted RNA-binding Zn-ribbon protein involved in translation (DUF1610 family)